MTEKQRKGIKKVIIWCVIAIIVFLIGTADYFKVAGNYNIISFGEINISDYSEELFGNDDAALTSMKLSLLGDVKYIEYAQTEEMQNAYLFKHKELLSGYEIRSIIEDRLDKKFKGAKWSLNYGRIRIEIDGEMVDNEYEFDGNTLTIGSGDEAIVLEKYGFGTSFNLGDLLKWIGILVLINQIIYLLRLIVSKPEKIVIPDLRCPQCNSKVKEKDRFCNICGNRFTEENRPKLAKLQPKCPNCGTQAAEGRDYCLNCGSPIER